MAPQAREIALNGLGDLPSRANEKGIGQRESVPVFFPEALPEATFDRKRDVTTAGRYAAIGCEPAPVHFQGSSSSIFVFG